MICGLETKSKKISLLVPGLRQGDCVTQMLDGQVNGLCPVKDLFGNVWSKVGEGQEPTDLIAIFFLLSCQFIDGSGIAICQIMEPEMCFGYHGDKTVIRVGGITILGSNDELGFNAALSKGMRNLNPADV